MGATHPDSLFHIPPSQCQVVALPSVWGKAEVCSPWQWLVPPDTVELFSRSVSTAHNEEGVLEGSAGGAAVVHQGSVFGCLCGW